MKRRAYKKLVKSMTDSEINEHVAYCENKTKIVILHAEFEKRFPELLEKDIEEILKDF